MTARGSPRSPGLLKLTGWSKGLRVLVRKERPHPDAQLRLTDVNGLRPTAFTTNTSRGQLPDLELRHRRRARCEVRIRNLKDTGLTNLPFHGFAQNQLWLEITLLAADLLTAADCCLLLHLQVFLRLCHPALCASLPFSDLCVRAGSEGHAQAVHSVAG